MVAILKGKLEGYRLKGDKDKRANNLTFYPCCNDIFQAFNKIG